VLKGAMMFQFDKKEVLIKEGQAVLVYRGETHSNYNAAADGKTEYLTVTG
jgi:mannose-6-phosphate isomerase-like protein (cupin superfamily)